MPSTHCQCRWSQACRQVRRESVVGCDRLWRVNYQRDEIAGAADGAYWIDKDTGAWITSTHYGNLLPPWVKTFNDDKCAEKYLNREWKDNNGNLLRTTALQKTKGGGNAGFYVLVGPTPLANDYES